MHLHANIKILYNFFLTLSTREKENMGLSEYDLYKEFLKTDKDCFHFSNEKCLVEFLKEEKSDEKVYLFLGAGDLPDVLNKISFLT